MDDFSMLFEIMGLTKFLPLPFDSKHLLIVDYILFTNLASKGLILIEVAIA